MLKESVSEAHKAMARHITGLMFRRFGRGGAAKSAPTSGVQKFIHEKVQPGAKLLTKPLWGGKAIDQLDQTPTGSLLQGNMLERIKKHFMALKADPKKIIPAATETSPLGALFTLRAVQNLAQNPNAGNIGGFAGSVIGGNIGQGAGVRAAIGTSILGEMAGKGIGKGISRLTHHKDREKQAIRSTTNHSGTVSYDPEAASTPGIMDQSEKLPGVNTVTQEKGSDDDIGREGRDRGLRRLHTWDSHESVDSGILEGSFATTYPQYGTQLFPHIHSPFESRTDTSNEPQNIENTHERTMAHERTRIQDAVDPIKQLGRDQAGVLKF